MSLHPFDHYENNGRPEGLPLFVFTRSVENGTKYYSAAITSCSPSMRNLLQFAFLRFNDGDAY